MTSKVLSIVTFVMMIIATAGTPTFVLAQTEAPELAPELPGNDAEMPPRRGFIPPRTDLRHLADYGDVAKSPAVLPTRFDWRTTGMVTPVKNQGACGACYSFATVGEIESKMLIAGEGTFDFSENNVKECNIQNTACDGGNYNIVANFLSQNGTALESCDSYTAANVACNAGCTYQKTLTGWTIISGSVLPSTATLQNHIYDNGPIYTSLYTGSANDPDFTNEFNIYDGSYALYYPDDSTINHAVVIVGWDDTLTHAGGTGAWIVKNSWGTSWGGTCDFGAEAGYFYMAYESASIGKWSSYMSEYMDYSATGSLLAYDDNGWTASWGSGVGTTAWGLCVFPIATQQYITRVEFWTNDVTTDVDVYIYDNFNGSSLSTLLASSLDNSYTEAGYHSVELVSPPQISAGNDIVAVVKITNSSYNYPIVSDNDGPSETTSTYLSISGGSGTWIDLDTLSSDDVAIRVRTSPTLALGAEDEPTVTPYRWGLSHNYPNPFNPSTTILYSLASRSHVTLTIYNVLGQEVNVLVDEVKSAGEYESSWDGSDFGGGGVASGIYFYRMVAGDHTKTAKMVLLR